jgi:P-type conjugative transfer ATPase TrbB
MAQLELSAAASDPEPQGSRDHVGEMLVRYLGPAITSAFTNDDVTEIYVNPQDTAIRVDTRSRGRIATGDTIATHRVEMFLNAVATNLGLTLTVDNPCLEAELPATVFRGSRLQGFIPPVTAGPAFTIRKPPVTVYSLDDYVAAKILTVPQCAVLREAVAKHRNVLIAGGTNSGKTTFANAVLKEIADQFPQERLVILEDTVELRCATRDYVALRTNPRMSLADLVRSALRTSPNRVIVGEVRGPEALDLLDVWATGHPGGVATLHASSAEGALLRLDRLAQRANVPPQADLIAETVHLVVVLEGGNSGRRVSDLVQVDGIDRAGRYRFDRLISLGGVYEKS